MFEVKLALKYLLPKKKALSTSLISLMSIGVISLVVWLILVFLSVTSGIEKNWLQKLTSLNAPVQISPTKEYYSSYYYHVDAFSSASSFSYKTLGEKLSSLDNPYQPEIDPALPAHLQTPEKFIDPVKLLEKTLKELPVRVADYEITGALMRLQTKREGKTSFLSQMNYLFSFPDTNPHLEDLILEPSSQELERLQKIDPSKVAPFVKEGKAITHFEKKPSIEPFWPTFYEGKWHLPKNSVLLPKSYQKQGARIGDTGYLSYVTMTSGASHEMRLPFTVCGFYDPGIMPTGVRALYVPHEITRTINASNQAFTPSSMSNNGFFVWTDQIKDAGAIKKALVQKLEKKGIAQFWDVKTYEEYEFSKDLMHQFQSDRILFMLIAIIIILVACSNIISLLVILVNDKKKEIAILSAIGASKRSIACIFGLSGVLMGSISSVLGTLAAIFTLRHLNTLVSFLSSIQGHDAFQTAFFGESLPNELSFMAVKFVLIVTPILSLIAGLIPAMKASKLKPSQILRSE